MLLDHQITGASWLASRPRGYLADEPGLGKTRTAIAALQQGSDVLRPLIVCPAIVRTHWEREFDALEARTGSRGLAPIVKSYDEITRGGNDLMVYLFQGEGIDALVLDEAHYLKHGSSKRTQQILGKDGYARRLERVYPLSGTPLPKHPGEFWTIMASLFPEVAREHGIISYRQWMDRFCVTVLRFARGQYVEKVVGVKNVAELQEILDKVMLRRTIADVDVKVPELQWQVLRMDGGIDEWAGDGGPVVEAALRNGDSLEEIANDPHVARMRRRLGELKVAPVVEMVRSQLADSDEKLVIFAHHRSVLAALAESLKTFGVAYIDGDTSQSARDIEIDRFQSHPRCRVFIGQNLACQTGVTLHASSRALLVEPDWTAVTNLQLGKRVARIGSNADSCIAQMVALAGTLDEAIVGQHAREVRMLAQSLGDRA